MAFVFICAMICVTPPGECAAYDFAELDTPIVLLPETVSADAGKRVSAALQSEEIRFVRGFSLNRFTTLIYQGDTIPLNKLLENLSRCSGVSIHVGFKNGGQSNHYLYGHDWAIHHVANEQRIQVIINTASRRVDLENLYLPDIGPAK